MKFGMIFDTHVDKWELIRYAEELGYDAAWVPDSQMIWSDCYATLALAAVNTKRIRLGTGVAIPGTRIAPVTAHSIASINQLAPGRVFLGIGTGHTAMRVMGMDPVKAGAYGDGRVCSHNQTRARLQKSLETMQQGAAAVGRTLPGDFHTAALSYACVLKPGEPLTSDRVIDEIGPMAAATLHYWWELYQKDGDTSTVAQRCRNLWDEYLAFTEKMETPLSRRYQQVHFGHCAFLPAEERRFITEDLIRATGGLVGTPDEIIAMLREREAMGLSEITLLPAMDTARLNLKDFAEQVIKRY